MVPAAAHAHIEVRERRHGKVERAKDNAHILAQVGL